MTKALKLHRADFGLVARGDPLQYFGLCGKGTPPVLWFKTGYSSFKVSVIHDCECFRAESTHWNSLANTNSAYLWQQGVFVFVSMHRGVFLQCMSGDTHAYWASWVLCDCVCLRNKEVKFFF